MQTKLISELNSVLKDFPQYWEGETLLRSEVIEDIKNKNPELLLALFNNSTIKSNYGTDIHGNLIFDFEKLATLLKYKEYWADSYTKFRNKIGLTTNGLFLNNNSDVVLDFPFKDCVLEAGMSTEESKKEEIYYNNVIAKDEIDCLLEQKVLTNWKKYSKDGVTNPREFNRNEEGMITDNLIIKGNNLIALSNLLEMYTGKVKCIYIDPPYNTGNDSFGYNDKFNHSTWLIFMKNRLELAKKLLRKDGSIFVQIDSFEQAYLKVLMDEVFGGENYRNTITWKRRGGSANPSNQLNNVAEWILWYSKDYTNMDYTPVYSLNDENTQKYIKERFVFVDENGRKFMKSPIQSPNYRENLIYDYKGYKTPAKGYSISKEVMEKWDKEGRLAFPDSKDKNINRKIFLDEYKGQPINSLWTDIFVINPMSNERNEFGAGQKPEALIKRFLDMCTKENELVLDFHLGSGTTAAVAHKMGRQYIGIEQMDYIEDIAVERLKKVIDGEQGGISKAVNWQDGGEFIYFELMKSNQYFIEQIKAASSYEDLMPIFDEMKEKAFLNYLVQLDEILKDSYEIDGINRYLAFSELDLHKQKELLIDLLDKNQLYVNYSSINDEELNISDTDKSLTEEFYS